MRKPEGNLRVLSGFSCQSPRPAALPPSIYLHCTVEETVGAIAEVVHERKDRCLQLSEHLHPLPGA